jgi:hypothetical protein
MKRGRIEETAKGRAGLRRIGRTTVERACWLIRFASTDLVALKGNQAERIAWELSAYIDVRLRRDLLVAQPMSGEEMRKCHAWLQEGLRALRTDGQRKFRIDPLPQHILRLDPPRFFVMGISLGFSPFKQVFALDTATVLAERLRFCPRPGCGVPFIKRKGQRYCSGRCSQTVRSQRFRNRNPNYRREHYDAEVKARLGGPNVKVQRRTSRAERLPPTARQRPPTP